MHDDTVMICTCCWVAAFLPSDPASEVIMLFTLSTGGGAFSWKLILPRCTKTSVQSQSPPRCERAAPAQIAPIWNLSPHCMNLHVFAAVFSAVNVPRCSAVAVFQQKFNPESHRDQRREKLREWSGNFCHHEHANGEPWYLQPVAAHCQRGHPQPSILHQLVIQCIL